MLLIAAVIGGELYLKWKAEHIQGTVDNTGGNIIIEGGYWHRIHVYGSDEEAIKALKILIQYQIPDNLKFDDSRLIDDALMGRGEPWRLSVTDKTMPYIGRMVWVKSLYLGGNRITDDGIRHLKNMHELRSLNLLSTHVTDNGLKHLSVLKSLEYLQIGDTEVTSDGLKRLMNELPTLNNTTMQGELKKLRQRERQKAEKIHAEN